LTDEKEINERAAFSIFAGSNWFAPAVEPIDVEPIDNCWMFHGGGASSAYHHDDHHGRASGASYNNHRDQDQFGLLTSKCLKP